MTTQGGKRGNDYTGRQAEKRTKPVPRAVEAYDLQLTQTIIENLKKENIYSGKMCISFSSGWLPVIYFVCIQT